jgi:alkanesulfonate monooxygenase SsuD/methylene tetrahydromethanopterin reductase-like flavin-dependent oxidoreductase (luciferase family)
VSLLSSGRFILGLGLGWSQTEFEGLGVDIHKRGQAMEEILSILPRAWSGEPFRHQGKVFDFPELAVRPTPSSRIPVLIGGGAEAAIRRAARSADGIFANVGQKLLVQQLKWIREECERIGRDPSELRIVHYFYVLPGKSEQHALDLYSEHLWEIMWKKSDMERSATRSGPPPAAPAVTEENRDQILGRNTLAGSTDWIVERMLDMREATEMPVELVARSYFPTLEQTRQLELMQQLAEDVAPHL